MTGPPAEPLSFAIEPDEGGRIDRLLAARFPGVGRRRWAALFASGDVEVDGARARKGDRVAAGSIITIRSRAALHPLTPEPQPELTLEVLHVDRRLVAVNKAAGRPSHPLRAAEIG